jgi:hypothetical protein
MVNDDEDPMKVRLFKEGSPDGKLLVRKQRLNGHCPICAFNFDSETKRAWRDPDDLVSYFHPKPPEEPEP